MKHVSMKRLLRGIAAIALLGVAATVAAAQPAPALPTDSIYQLPLPLTDSHGKTADWRTLRGKPRLVSMFYTSCQYICPLIVESGKAVERQLTPAQQQHLGVVLISMDPARDTLLIEHTPIDTLDFASPVAGLGSKMGLDATDKWPGETTREWGRPLAMDEAVRQRMHTLAEALGL